VNRSAPDGPVIPVLSYADVRAAVEWLVQVLGFEERVRIGDGHRAQLAYGAGALIVADAGNHRAAPGAEGTTASVMLRVEDLDELWAKAIERGAEPAGEPTDFPYGERQASFRDPGGHHWTLTETVRDVAPEEWGGASVGD
jgi:uncharacterized glyoxalase superfamily protein PhnB